MDASFWIEGFGYLASFIVVFSLTRTNVKNLWIINGIGAIGFITYACIIGSYPTALMNLGALVIDIVQLYRYHHNQVQFEVVATSGKSAYFNWFTNKYAADIAKYDPEQQYKKAEKLYYYVCDNEVAGLLGFTPMEDGCAEIYVDYLTCKFRNRHIGAHIFGADNKFFSEAGIHKFKARTENPKHKSYLKEIGFTLEADGYWTKSV